MKERPILFSAEMVRALLDGRKTQTRRVAKLNAAGRVKLPGSPHNWHCEDPDAALACPYGQPGDRLWVRETWQQFWKEEIPAERYSQQGRSGSPSRRPETMRVVYRADGEISQHPEYGEAIWRPSIHMPRWASRILLEITNVRVERVQEISDLDARAEGLEAQASGCGWQVGDKFHSGHSVDCFSKLWDSINAARGFGWDVNPWVWVIEFRRAEP
jgi:hypothetical protein